MSTSTEGANPQRRMIERHRADVYAVLARFGASHPRLFGSVARGDAGPRSDIDILVNLEPQGGNPLLRVAGIGEELSAIFGVRVDVVADVLLREPVSASAHAEAVPL